MPLIKGQGSMLSCLKLPQSPTNNHVSSPTSQGHSGDNTAASSVQPSPTINLSREFTRALQTHSYGEIRRTLDQDTSSFDQNVETGHIDTVPDSPHLLSQVLQPSRECVQETLSQIAPNSLTHLVTTYFEYTERTSRLCLHLHHCAHHARLLYAPIYDLLDVIPLDSDGYSLSDSQASSAFNIFLKFDSLGNPFLPSDTHNFDEMRNCFSELRQQLHRHIRKSKSRVEQMRNCSTGSALCLIAATAGVVISAVVIASHALVALVAAGPLCPLVFPPGVTKKEMVRLAQLDAADKGVFVLCNYLETINRLVASLHAAVEHDRFIVHWGLERGGVDGHSILEALKQVRRNRSSSLVQQFEYLTEQICLCYAAINRARSLLLQELLHTQQQDPV